MTHKSTFALVLIILFSCISLIPLNTVNATQTYALLTLAQPEDLTATIQSGGSLAASTTYYYQIFAVRRDVYCSTISPRSITVSATTNATFKTIYLDWTAIPGYTPASYFSYHILRNTVDSFTDAEKVLIASAGSGIINVLTDYWADTGAYDPTITDFGYTANLKDGVPTIAMWGGTGGDIIKMWDIYQADIANGWGRVFLAANTTYMEYESNKARGGDYYSHANLLIGYDSSLSNKYTAFSHQLGSITIYGGGIHSSFMSYIYFGYKVNTYDAYVRGRVTIMTHAPAVFGTYSELDGHIYAYGLYLTQGGSTWGTASSSSQYTYYGWNNPYAMPAIYPSAGSEFFDCDFPDQSNGFIIAGTATFRNCRFGGISMQSTTANIISPKITTSEGLGFRYADNQLVTSPWTTYYYYDSIWRPNYHASVINPIFDSHAQSSTTNDPWIYLGWTNLNHAGSFIVWYSMKLSIRNSLGNPLSGVTVTLTDAFENSNIWSDSGATFNGDVAKTDTSIVVSDGTKFAINDMIREEGRQEVMKVTNIVANTLTVIRTQYGTSVQSFTSGLKIFKQVASLTTDANGLCDVSNFVSYILYATSLVDGLAYMPTPKNSTDWIAAGYMTKTNYCPLTLSISDSTSVYQNYTAILSPTAQINWGVTLSPTIHGVLNFPFYVVGMFIMIPVIIIIIMIARKKR